MRANEYIQVARKNKNLKSVFYSSSTHSFAVSVSKSFDISSPYPSPWINESLRSRPLEWINIANSKLWFFPNVEGEQKLPGPTMWLHIVATDWSSGTQARESVPAKCPSDLRDSHFLPPGQQNREGYSARKRRQVSRRGREGRPRGREWLVLSVPRAESLPEVQLRSSWRAPVGT